MGDPYADDPWWQEAWPLFGLRLTTPRLELRPLTPALVAPIAEVAVAGIHDPATMPFEVPFTDADPTTIRRESFRWWARCWVDLGPEQWRIPFAVLHDGEPIGVQDINAEQFGLRRTFSTGSWLGRPAQGQGFGQEMRRAVLTFAFAGLDARRAETGAWTDNAASIGVTTRLGYQPDGTRVKLRRGVADEQVAYRMTAADFAARPDLAAGVRIDGLSLEVLAMLGAGPSDPIDPTDP